MRTRQSVVIMSRKLLASSTAMFVFDYNKLENGLLVSSIFILTSGMMFQVRPYHHCDRKEGGGGKRLSPTLAFSAFSCRGKRFCC